VRQFIAEQDHWVIDGNYHRFVQDIVWEHADTVVWLDLPRWRVMSQVIARTLRRQLSGEELWNGNRERWPQRAAPATSSATC
jgi:adenylate kinase family enzyme